MIVEKDKIVFINIETKTKDGVVIDSTRHHGSELSYIHGHGNLIKKIEDGIQGEEEGYATSIVVDHVDAFGEYNEGFLISVPMKNLSDDIEIKVGTQVQTEGPEGTVDMYIKEINNDANEVVMDANHPLAGVDLIFEVEVVRITDAHKDEIKHSRVNPVLHNIMIEDSSLV